MARGELFTAEEDAKIAELWTGRFSVKEIGTALGRPIESIRHRISALGLKRWNTKHWTAQEEDQLKRLYAAHMPVEEIAVALNRSVLTVRNRACLLGLLRDGRKTRLAKRYGIEILANGKDPVLIVAEAREAEQRQIEENRAAHLAQVTAALDEMERGLAAGCDRAFMFTAALVGGATLQNIADRVGITRERVRQIIEKRADTLQTDQIGAQP